MTTAAAQAPHPVAVLRPRRWWVRALAVAVLVCWAVFGFLAIGFLTIASPALGWLWATLAYLPGVAAAVALFGIRRRRDMALVAVVASALLGGFTFLSAPPDHARIERAGNRALAHLAGARVVDHHERGNTWCFKGCPEVTFSIDSDLPPAAAAAAVADSLEEAGWHGGPVRMTGYRTGSEYTPLAHEQWWRGRWDATVTVLSPASRRLSEGADSKALTRVEVEFSG
ncbi:hypothetical protein [Knoellia aerolata]|uniref:hypothetical protein n=1 Tax=Knoellia aerolata TaxID=442954 RepID=UPI0012EE1115|nr:hypothetical protein [Knoellia aerolata]